MKRVEPSEAERALLVLSAEVVPAPRQERAEAVRLRRPEDRRRRVGELAEAHLALADRFLRALAVGDVHDRRQRAAAGADLHERGADEGQPLLAALRTERDLHVGDVLAGADLGETMLPHARIDPERF